MLTLTKSLGIFAVVMEYVNYVKRIIRKGRKRDLNRDHGHRPSDEVCMTSSTHRVDLPVQDYTPHTSIVDGLEPQTDDITMLDSNSICNLFT